MKIIVGFIAVVAMAFISCEKATNCWGKTVVNEGEIMADTTICNNCNFIANEEKGVVINTTLDMQRVFQKYYQYKVGCELNTFNLDKYSLLAMPVFTTCKYKIHKNVTIDDSEKKYIYEITVDECGSCEESNYHANWVMIPKLKSGYSVTFIVNKVRE
jgi:hypothetical protein